MITSLIPQNVIDYVAKHKEVPIRKIVALVKKDLNIILTYHNVRDIINALKDHTGQVQDNLHELNDAIEQDIRYELTEDYYIFYAKRPNMA
jgi:uncharacterized protein YpuA (DUF1002 family)